MTPYSEFKLREFFGDQRTAPDSFVLTKDQVFSVVSDIRKEAAREVCSRRQMKATNSRTMHSFATGAYVSFDESANRILDEAKLTLADYRDWRRTR